MEHLNTRYCHLRCNEELRETIKFMILQRKVSIRQIGRETSLPHERISRYLQKEHMETAATLNQWQLLRVCEYFNINVALKVGYDGDPKDLINDDYLSAL